MSIFRHSPNVERLSEQRNVAALCRALVNEDPAVRANAATALGNLRDPAAIEALIAAICDPDESVPPRAMEALVKIHDPGAIDPLLELVIRPVLHPSGLVNIGGLCEQALASFGAAAVAPTVAAMDTGRLYKPAALAILHAMPESDELREALAKIEREREDLARRLTDATDPQVRQQALKDLDSYVSGSRLSQGWAPRTAREAVWTLIVRRESAMQDDYRGEPLDSPYLHTKPDHDRYCQLCGEARELLAYGAQQVAGELLAAMARDDVAQDAYLVQLLWSLADHLDESVIEPLAVMAEEGDVGVAYFATCALINIKSDQVMPVLERIATSTRSFAVNTCVGTETDPDDPDEIWPIMGVVDVENVGQRRIAKHELRARRRARSAS